MVLVRWKRFIGTSAFATLNHRHHRLRRAVMEPFFSLKKVRELEGRVKVQEGMWEDPLGKKVFGGERRRAETLHKLGVAEHRKAIGAAR